MAKRNVRSEVSPLSPSKLGPPLLLLPSSSPFLSSSPLTIVRAKERESFHERESHLACVDIHASLLPLTLDISRAAPRCARRAAVYQKKHTKHTR